MCVRVRERARTRGFMYVCVGIAVHPIQADLDPILGAKCFLWSKLQESSGDTFTASRFTQLTDILDRHIENQ